MPTLYSKIQQNIIVDNILLMKGITMNTEFTNLLIVGITETLYMTLASTLFSYLAGIPLGMLLYATADNSLSPNKLVNTLVGFVVNMLRSAPFIILLLALIPITRFILGTTIGVNAVVLPLVVAATPFVARMVEASFKEVDSGVIEASQAMGCNNAQILFKVLLSESLPSIITGCTIAVTTILGYSAMAGFVGGGGLGTIAINYGLYRYETGIMLITLALLIIIVQLFQTLGIKIANKIDKRKIV